MNALRLLGRALVKFDRDRGLFLASGIAFQRLLCLIPLTLLLLSFAGPHLSPTTAPSTSSGGTSNRPRRRSTRRCAGTCSGSSASAATYGVVGTIGLLWIATTVFGWLRIALNTIFGVPKARGTLRGFAAGPRDDRALGRSVPRERRADRRGRVPAAGAVARSSRPRRGLLEFALAYVVPFLVTVLFCFLIYRLVPNRRVPRAPPPGRPLHGRPLGGGKAPLRVVRPHLQELLDHLRFPQRRRGGAGVDLLLRGGAAARGRGDVTS